MVHIRQSKAIKNTTKKKYLMHTTLIIPAYNEENNINNTLSKVIKIVDRVILVDNCSEDKTIFNAQKHDVIILKHKVNIGKSNSMKTGCELAIKLGTDLIAFMDADGQHEPSDLEKLINEIKSKKNLDMVVGVRNYLKMPITRLIGTKILSFVTSIFYQSEMRDIQSGLRVFNSKIYNDIIWDSTGSSHYFADAEITTIALSKKIPFSTIPIETIFNDKFKGMDIFQGLRLVLHLIFWRIIK
tara:strand:+ start:307 stop:1032 length:726 start_codon:yes stop_codon:yes gene_type:complete